MSAALSSSSLVFQPSDPAYAAQLLNHSVALYNWAKARPGSYNDAYPEETSGYTTSRYVDKLMFAAAWLYRATGDTPYLQDAQSFWQEGDRDIFVSWDSTTAAAAILLLPLPGVLPPFSTEYQMFVKGYISAWQSATGGVVKTPKGLHYPSWSQWGNLRHSANAAFMQVVYHRHTPCATCLAWAKGQADYMLGSR